MTPHVSLRRLIESARIAKENGPRPHMGCSLLGHKCNRWLWLSFRWAVIEDEELFEYLKALRKKEPPIRSRGQLLGIFRRGHREEDTIVEDLRSAGLVIHDESRQIQVDFGKFVGGSIDGIVESGVPAAPKTRHLLECKTHSLKSFNELVKANSVREAKFTHWVQMQLYMHALKLKRALYFAVCKDNDDFHYERVEYDKEAAEAFVSRGHYLTMLERLPEPMLGAGPDWWECRLCAGYRFCWDEHLTREVNCRTCAHSTPLEESRFKCELGQYEPVRKCRSHVLHPDLVPWEIRDIGDAECAGYVVDGELVVNGFSGLSSEEMVEMAVKK